MSTNAYVFIAKENDLFDGIYVHSDGYLRGVGQTLFKHYRNTEKIKELINLGGISSLDGECMTSPPYTFMNNDDMPRVPGYTFAYHRDRGDSLDIIENITSETLITHSNDYTYIWKNNEWWLLKNNEWHLLEKCLKELEIEHNNYTYTNIPSQWEMSLTEDAFNETIRNGFLITNDASLKLHDSIRFLAKDPSNEKKHYELLVKITKIEKHEGLKEDYKLLILKKPPADICWFQSII